MLKFYISVYKFFINLIYNLLSGLNYSCLAEGQPISNRLVALL